jgi:hypothetical protein
VFGEALKVNSSLSSLDLENNYLGPLGGVALVSGLKSNFTLTFFEPWIQSTGRKPIPLSSLLPLDLTIY